MLNRDEVREIICKLTSYTKNYAAVTISNDGERLTRFANSEIHQNVEIENISVSLTVYSGKKEATCTTNVIADEGLRQLANDADEMLSLSPDSEFDIIPLPNEEVKETINDVRLSENFGITQRAEIAKKCIETLDPDYTASGLLKLDTDMRAFGNSSGVFRFCCFDSVSFSAVVTHKDGATGYGAVTTANLDNCDILGAFKTAYDKAKMAVNPQLADIGSYTVILEPAAVAGLMSYIIYGLNAASVRRGTSYAAGKLNQKVFGENMTVTDDVNNPATFQCFFDAEGYKKTTLPLIENGVIKNLLYDSKTAFKDGVKSTGHAMSNKGLGGVARNIVMNGGDSTLEEMIKGTKKGILITHFHYTNTVNQKKAQITGLTRDGSFMIIDGEIAYPIINMRFTEDLIEAFCNVTELSKDLTNVGAGLFPAAKIENFHFTSRQK